MTANKFCVIKKKMEKKEIYEHLARIYLDASLKYKKKKKFSPFLFFSLTGIAVIFLSIFIVFKFLPLKLNPSDYQVALTLTYEPIKVNFNFNPVKKEIFTLPLNNMNLENFKILSFRIRKSDFYDNIHLRIEFVNSFNEKGVVYIDNILNKWKEFNISLKDFKGITYWSEMQELMFIVEEWNSIQKSGRIYLDDIKLLK